MLCGRVLSLRVIVAMGESSKRRGSAVLAGGEGAGERGGFARTCSRSAGGSRRVLMRDKC